MRELHDLLAALGMARRDDGEQPAEIAAQPLMRLEHQRVLAGVRRGGGLVPVENYTI